jgi:uncharacterized membrane protein
MFGVCLGINTCSDKLIVSEDSGNKSSSRKYHTGDGIAVGAAVGVALGAAFDQLALGIGLGAAFGAVVDVVSHVRNKSTKGRDA